MMMLKARTWRSSFRTRRRLEPKAAHVMLETVPISAKIAESRMTLNGNVVSAA